MQKRVGQRVMGVLASVAALSLLSMTPAHAESEERNIALGQPVVASGVELADKWGPEKAVDGNDGNGATADQGAADASRWSGPGDRSAHLTVQLPANAEAKRARIQWAGACATEYEFQYSTDGQVFHPASQRVRKTGDECFKKSIETPLTIPANVKPTHLRLQSFALRNQWGPSLWEFEIWGKADAPAPPAPPATDVANVVPLPASVVAGEGTFTLPANASISVSGGGEFAANDLAELLRRSTGYALPIGEAGTIKFVLDPALADAGTEGYELTVTPDGVTAKAKTEAGLFYASRTLLQLLGPWATSPEAVKGPWQIPAQTIVDKPRYEYRGLMVDVVRSFLTQDEMLSVIDQMAHFKLNKLHLHLSDDQGWRVEITNDGRVAGDSIDYSLLTSVSGKTAVLAAKWAPITSAPGAPVVDGSPRVPGIAGFYTTHDVRTIVAYAAARNIEVIPEIDGPAHSNAQLHAIPELNGGGSHPVVAEGQTTPAITDTSVGDANMGARNENTYKFLAHVFGQVTSMMPGKYLHLGGDEPHKITGADYATFMERTMPLITARGRIPMVWNEAAAHADKLPDGTVIQYWNGQTLPTRNAILSGRGMKLIMTPATNTYFPQRQASALGGPSWACDNSVCDLERFYNWDPARSGPAVGDEHMLGVSAAFWAEHTRGIKDSQFRLFPRLLATAEVAWTPQADRSFAGFVKRMPARGVALNLAGANFYADPKVAWAKELRADAKVEADGNLAYLSAPADNVEAATVTVRDANGQAVPASLVGVTATERGADLRRPGDGMMRAVNTTFVVRTAKTDLSAPIAIEVNVGGKALSVTADVVVPAAPEPSAPTPEPSAPTPEPSAPTPEPSAPTPEPSAPTPEPSAPTPEPSAPTPEPSAPTPEPSPTVDAPTAQRLAGADRVGTAIAAAKDGGYTPGVALLATGKDYADAVTAGPLAGALDAPLYFTVAGTLEPAVLKAMRDSQVTKVYIVGGTKSVSVNKEHALRAANIEVVRVHGADRFGTAQAIVAELTKLGKAPKRFFLADSSAYPDALGAGVAAGRNEGAVLLTRGKTIPAATAAVLAAASQAPVVLVGGSAVNFHFDAMRESARKVDAVYGSDRYVTAADLYRAYCSDATKLVVASGENFADALAAGGRALADDGALVLVRHNQIPRATTRVLNWHKIKKLELLGGERSVSNSVFNELKGKMRP